MGKIAEMNIRAKYATKNADGKTLTVLEAGDGIEIVDDEITVKAGGGLICGSDGRLNVYAGNNLVIEDDILNVDVEGMAGSGLTFNNDGVLEVNDGEGLKIEDGILSVDYGYGLDTNESGNLYVPAGPGIKHDPLTNGVAVKYQNYTLDVDGSGQLFVKSKNVVDYAMCTFSQQITADEVLDDLINIDLGDTANSIMPIAVYVGNTPLFNMCAGYPVNRTAPVASYSFGGNGAASYIDLTPSDMPSVLAAGNTITVYYYTNASGIITPHIEY